MKMIKKLEHNEMIRKYERRKKIERYEERNLIRVTESECLKMLTTLALLPFREVPFARNEKNILEKGSERRNSGRRSFR